MSISFLNLTLPVYNILRSVLPSFGASAVIYTPNHCLARPYASFTLVSIVCSNNKENHELIIIIKTILLVQPLKTYLINNFLVEENLRAKDTHWCTQAQRRYRHFWINKNLCVWPKWKFGGKVMFKMAVTEVNLQSQNRSGKRQSNSTEPYIANLKTCKPVCTMEESHCVLKL